MVSRHAIRINTGICERVVLADARVEMSEDISITLRTSDLKDNKRYLMSTSTSVF